MIKRTIATLAAIAISITAASCGGEETVPAADHERVPTDRCNRTDPGTEPGQHPGTPANQATEAGSHLHHGKHASQTGREESHGDPCGPDRTAGSNAHRNRGRSSQGNSGNSHRTRRQRSTANRYPCCDPATDCRTRDTSTRDGFNAHPPVLRESPTLSHSGTRSQQSIRNPRGDFQTYARPVSAQRHTSLADRFVYVNQCWRRLHLRGNNGRTRSMLGQQCVWKSLASRRSVRFSERQQRHQLLESNHRDNLVVGVWRQHAFLRRQNRRDCRLLG